MLSRELRRKGPVRWDSRRGLATSETRRVRYYSQYCEHSAMVGLGLEVSTAPTRLWLALCTPRDLVGPSAMANAA